MAHFEVEIPYLTPEPNVLETDRVFLLSAFVTPLGAGELAVDGLPRDAAIEGSGLVPPTVERNLNYLGFGRYRNCGSFHGALFELLLYERALSTASEIGLVTEYLRTKWQCCGS